MTPRKYELALDVTPKHVIDKISSNINKLEKPDGVIKVIASSDLNLSKYITTVIIGFERDGTAHLLWRKFRKCRVDAALPEGEYTSRVYNLLSQHAQELQSLELKLDAWVIDANGLPFDAVTSFSKSSPIPTAGFIGKASHVYTSFSKSRLRDDVKNTLLCGDAREHVKSGAGKKWTFWDSDKYREMVHKAILQAPGALGGLDFYLQSSDEMTDWAIQLTNEKLKYNQNSSQPCSGYSGFNCPRSYY